MVLISLLHTYQWEKQLTGHCQLGTNGECPAFLSGLLLPSDLVCWKGWPDALHVGHSSKVVQMHLHLHNIKKKKAHEPQTRYLGDFSERGDEEKFHSPILCGIRGAG